MRGSTLHEVSTNFVRKPGHFSLYIAACTVLKYYSSFLTGGLPLNYIPFVFLGFEFFECNHSSIYFPI